MTHRRDETTDAAAQPPRFITTLAEDADTVRAAQRLRYRVFHAAAATSGAASRAIGDVDEGGAADRIDEDAFDAHCKHLVVRDAASRLVIGTYRILTAEGARAAGGFYSETEFDCARLRARDVRLVEVGRACVDPAYRGGGVIAALLAGLTRFVVAERYEYVMGCASVALTAGTVPAAALCRRLVDRHLAPAEWRAVPHTAFHAPPAASDAAEVPPLLKAYLRFGASICGEPAFDESFRTADLLMLLPMAAMAPRFRARLLRDDPGTRKGRSNRWAA
jgi:putative hemolysin